MSPAGYSGTALAKKLGIKDGDVVVALDAPEQLPDLLAPLPDGVVLRHAARGTADVSLVFCATRKALERRRPQLWTLAFPDRPVWVCWPKKVSPLFVDLTEDQIRDVVLPDGLVDVKVCAVDEDWSGLKVMVRRELLRRLSDIVPR